jgi:hypothetical protein
MQDQILAEFKDIQAKGAQASDELRRCTDQIAQLQQQAANLTATLQQLSGAGQMLLKLDPTVGASFEAFAKAQQGPAAPATDPVPPNLAAHVPTEYAPVAQAVPAVAVDAMPAPAVPGVTGGTVTQYANGITFEAKDGEVQTVRDVTITPDGITANTPAPQA